MTKLLTLAEARHNYKSFKKLSNTENNPHLRKHYEDKAKAAQAVLKAMHKYGNDLKPPRTPWARMNIKSDHFEAVS